MSYWLSPVYTTEPLAIGKERIQIKEKEALEIRDYFVSLEPFFLPFLKTHILPEGENENVCGVDEFSLEGDQDVVFDGNPLNLSKCGMAFIRKLPTLTEIKKNREKNAEEINRFREDHSSWMELIERWWNQDYIVVLFKD